VLEPKKTTPLEDTVTPDRISWGSGDLHSSAPVTVSKHLLSRVFRVSEGNGVRAHEAAEHMRTTKKPLESALKQGDLSWLAFPGLLLLLLSSLHLTGEARTGAASNPPPPRTPRHGHRDPHPPRPISPQLSHPFSLPNPILYLGIPCALVKLME
jgi:hypothetical protein